MKKSGIAAAVALLLATQTQIAAAAGDQFFGQIGFSDYGYSNDGVAIKVGADFASNLGGVKHMGLTAFYAHTEADNDFFGNKWDYETHTFALGPAFTFPIQGSKLSLQGRVFLELDRSRVRSPGGSASDTDIDIGLGLGAQFALDNKMSLRFDYDTLNNVDTLTIGVGVKF
jgi:opacity protein-like surface antigen